MIDSSVNDCKVIELPKVTNRAGNITAVENMIHIPFKITRIYYLYDIPGGEIRGGHAHKQLDQLLVAISGSFDVVLEDGNEKKTIHLNRPYYGLHIIPGIWRELNNFSSGAVCLVLASNYYDEEDYVRDFKSFLEMKGINANI